MKFLDKTLDIARSLVRPHPLRDWYIVLAFVTVVFISVVATTTGLFLGIRSGSITTPPNIAVGALPSISREKLEETVAEYELRQINYVAGNIRTPDVSDPSR